MERKPPTITLPTEVQHDVAPFLEPGEQLLDAVRSTSGPVGKLGELWLILTDHNVLCYTREYNKEAMVSRIGRQELAKVKYEHHALGTTLTFVPANRPQNAMVVPFPKQQRPQVNRFSELLSTSVAFEVVTPQERTVKAPSATATPTTEKPAAPAPAAKPAPPAPAPTPVPPKPATPPTAGASPVSTAAKTPAPAALDLRSVLAAPGAGNPGSRDSAEKPISPVAGKNHEAPTTGPATPTSEAAATGVSPTVVRESTTPGTIAQVTLATVLALLVGWLWYRLFVALQDRR